MNRKKVCLFLLLSFVISISQVFAAGPTTFHTNKTVPSKKIAKKNKSTIQPSHKRETHSAAKSVKPPQVVSVKAPNQVKAGTEFSIEIKAQSDLGLSSVQIDFAGKKNHLSASGKKYCTLKTKLKSNQDGKQRLAIIAIDKKNHLSKTYKKNILVLVINKQPEKVSKNNHHRTIHHGHTAISLKNNPPIVKKISAPLSVGSGQPVLVQYSLSDDKGLRAMLVTAWGEKKIIKLRGRTANGSFKLTAGKPGTAILKITALDSGNLKSREITRTIKVRAKPIIGKAHSKPTGSIHPTQNSVSVAGSPSKINSGKSFPASAKQNPFTTAHVSAEIGKGRRSLGSLGKDLGRRNDLGGQLPAGIKNSGNSFGKTGGAAGYAAGIGKTDRTIGPVRETFADQMKPRLVTGKGAQREGQFKLIRIIDNGNMTTVYVSPEIYKEFVDQFKTDTPSPSNTDGNGSTVADWAFGYGVDINFERESDKKENDSTIYSGEPGIHYSKNSVESQREQWPTNEEEPANEEKGFWGTVTGYWDTIIDWFWEDDSGNEEVSNNDNGSENTTTVTNDGGSEDTTTVTDDGDSEDQGKDNGDSDDEDDDNDKDKNGKSTNGGMEVDQGPDDNSTADGRWIDQAKVKDTQTSGPGGKGTVDFAPGEEGGSTGEGGIGPGNFKDMSPSQVHTVEGMDAISHEFEDLNQNIQDNIKNGGPATTQIHTMQD